MFSACALVGFAVLTGYWLRASWERVDCLWRTTIVWLNIHVSAYSAAGGGTKCLNTAFELICICFKRILADISDLRAVHTHSIPVSMVQFETMPGSNVSNSTVLFLFFMFSACGRLRTGINMPVLTAYFPMLA